MLKLFSWMGMTIQIIITLFLLIIDRQLLVFAPWLSSYSAQELLKRPKRKQDMMFFRSMTVVLIVLILLIIKYLF